jgi:PmbA protein
VPTNSYDIYTVRADTLPVTFEAGRLTEISGKVSEFSACRVIAGGKAGYTISNKLTEDEMVARAAAAAPFGKAVNVTLPEPAPLPEVPAFAADVEKLEAADMAAWGERVIAAVKKGIGRDLPINVEIEKQVANAGIKNSRGVDYRHASSDVSIGVQITDAREGDIHWVFDFDFSTDAAGLDVDGVANNAVALYHQGRETTGVETGPMDILVHPFALPQFLLPFLVGISGEKVKDGTSPLKNRLGERIFHDALTIVDEPLWPGSSSSAPFDGEGVVARTRPIIENGVLKSFNHTLDTAGAAGVEPTGGASRGPDGKPVPGLFNLIIAGGETPFDDMLAAVDRGLFVRFMAGSGMTNVLAGEFAMGVYSGYLIEKGKLTKRLKNVMAAGNVYDVFKRVGAVSRERVKSSFNGRPHALLPYVLLEKVSVAGS